MANFYYDGRYYDGINPSGLTFSRQTSTTCWAASIANARSAFYKKCDLSDQDLVAKIFPENHTGSYGLTATDLLDAILKLAEFTQVTLVKKATFMLNEFVNFDLLTTLLEAERPVILIDYDATHVVLALAHSGGNDFLVYNSQQGADDGKATGIPAWAKAGGLTNIKVSTIGKDHSIIGLAKHVATG